MDGVEGGSWNLLSRRNLFVWEEGLFQSLLGEVEGWVKTVSVDSWWWKLEDEGKFTVSSSYEFLVGLVSPHEFLLETKEMVFGSVWKSLVPSKVVAFYWQLLLDRIPTKDNLLRRRILPPEASVRCVFCDQVGETAGHLFLHCNMIFKVWAMVCGWLEINFITPQSLFQHFECWSGEIGKKRLCKGYWMVWHAVLWTIGFLTIL
ncbi:uncharacterized protein [Medicago truncatula]|uniref:uncharacterized protein n=1 Tax=Medicago truncatula TaxID=3880 RepID=UPI001967EDD1|nr:uncharacterized protein LOC120580473 [Medicago truncatula]